MHDLTRRFDSAVYDELVSVGRNVERLGRFDPGLLKDFAFRFIEIVHNKKFNKSGRLIRKIVVAVYWFEICGQSREKHSFKGPLNIAIKKYAYPVLQELASYGNRETINNLPERYATAIQVIRNNFLSAEDKRGPINYNEYQDHWVTAKRNIAAEFEKFCFLNMNTMGVNDPKYFLPELERDLKVILTILYNAIDRAGTIYNRGHIIRILSKIVHCDAGPQPALTNDTGLYYEHGSTGRYVPLFLLFRYHVLRIGNLMYNDYFVDDDDDSSS